jgi:hypothetical protein
VPKTMPATALEDDKLDSYGVRIRNGLYEVRIAKGQRRGLGVAENERDAYTAARADLAPAEKGGK